MAITFTVNAPAVNDQTTGLQTGDGLPIPPGDYRLGHRCGVPLSAEHVPDLSRDYSR